MFVQILLTILGMAIVIFGAEALVEGASSFARKLGVSEFIIGLTIMGIGTSLPELVVSFTGAIQGNADVAVGNIVGSNIFNIFIILGLAALVDPIDITRTNLKRDIPLNIAGTALLILLGMSHSLFGIGGSDIVHRWTGILFVILFFVYLYFSVKHDDRSGDSGEEPKDRKLWVSIVMTVAGLAALVGGGRLFVDSSTALARMAGWSDAFIAITILAVGTSLPELTTCLAAARKHKDSMALGNILGSNISNLLLVLGGSAVITPLGMDGMGWVDLLTMLLSAVILFVVAYTYKKDQLDRYEGIGFLLIYAAYFVWLLKNLH